MLSKAAYRLIGNGSIIILITVAAAISNEHDLTLYDWFAPSFASIIILATGSQMGLAALRWILFTEKQANLRELITAGQFNAICYVANLLPLPGAIVGRALFLKEQTSQPFPTFASLWYSSINISACLFAACVFSTVALEGKYFQLTASILAVLVGSQLVTGAKLSISALSTSRHFLLEIINVCIQTLKIFAILLSLQMATDSALSMALLASVSGIIVAATSFVPGGGIGSQELSAYYAGKALSMGTPEMIVVALVIARLFTICSNALVILTTTFRNTEIRKKHNDR